MHIIKLYRFSIVCLTLCTAIIFTRTHTIAASPLIKETAISQTTDIVTLNNNENIFYHIPHVGKQKVYVNIEVIESKVLKPTNLSLDKITLSPNIPLIDGKLYFISEFNPNHKFYDDENAKSIWYRLNIVQTSEGYTAKPQYSSGKKSDKIEISDEFINNGDYLRISSRWSGYNVKSEDIDAYFKFRIIISKDVPSKLVWRCKNLKFLPEWLFKFVTGIDTCNLDLNYIGIKKEPGLDISENAKSLAKMLAKPDYEKLKASNEPNPEFYKDSYCKFDKEPNHINIPLKAKSVYFWSNNWNPKIYPENYIECTAFVHMVYNIIGVSFKDKKLGDPINWPKRKDLFDVFESGKSSEIPKVGDIMIWDATKDNKHGHVGVVSEVRNAIKIFEVSNGNSYKKLHQFYYKSDGSKTYILTEDGQNIGWKPRYILRLKLK